MASGMAPDVYAAPVSAGEEGAVVWVLLDADDGARPGVLEALEAEPGLVPDARPWPGRKERGTPAAVVVRDPALERLMALKHRLGGAKAVVLAAPDTSRDDARAVISQGADAVLLDEDVPRLVASAVRAALDGLLALSVPLGAAVERPPLTPREKQILALVVMGYTNREIADQLVLAESTVKSHLFSAFRRLGVRSRSEAVALITDPARGLGSGILTIPRE
jgi:DNA-binding NarL/FixJ family response regulator